MKDINFDKNKILIIGDLILDEYILGTSSYLSYESPIPIVKREITEYQLGGAGNIVNNIISLGGSCDIITILGNDKLKNILESKLEEIPISKDLILTLDDYQNNLTTRIISGGKHVARIDNPIHPLKSKSIFYEFLKEKLENANKYSLILIQDSGRFFIDENIIELIISKAIDLNIKVILDIPNNIKSKYKFEALKGATLLRTHLNYIKFISGIPADVDLTQDELEKICFAFIEETKVNSLVVTLGSGGLLYVEKDKSKFVDGFKVFVFDVSGAGDSLVSTLCLCFSSEIALEDTLLLANISGHIACRYLGTTPIELIELMEAYKILVQNNESQ